MSIMNIELNSGEVDALGDIIEGTIDTLIDWSEDDPIKFQKTLDFWNNIRVKLGLDPIKVDLE